MKLMKRFISIFILITFIFTLSGCRKSKQELNELGVVLNSGFDLSSDGKYIFTAQILNTQGDTAATSKNNTNETSSDVVVFSALGDTPYSAANNLGESYGKPLFFGHSRYIVLGENLASSGLSLFIDSLLRIRTTRPDTLLLVTKGMAADIVKASTSNERIPSNEIENIHKFQNVKGYSPMVSGLEFANSLSNKTSAPILGTIALKNKYGTDNTFDVSGTAVFKGDKLIGFMNDTETRGVQWVRGRVQGGIILGYFSPNKLISFFQLQSKSKITPILKGNSISIQIDIKSEGNVVEMSAPLNPMKNHKIMYELNASLSNAIKNEILAALNTAQKKYKLDIFNFGNTIEQKYPDFWNKNKKNWSSIFPNIKIDVNVTSNVNRPGVISKPVK